MAGRSLIYPCSPKNVNALNEVVVTAIGIERGKRKPLGYAVSEVDSDDITQKGPNRMSSVH